MPGLHMRVITTNVYFDEKDVQGYEGYRPRPRRDYDGKNPGVAFAWFGTNAVVHVEDIDNYKYFKRIQQGSTPLAHIRGTLDLFIRDEEDTPFFSLPADDSVKSGALVDFLLDQSIVIERSPPFSLSLKGVLTSANTPLWIGTFAGGAAAWDHPVLLLLTVPGGIIAVSSASGIGRALEAGLNKALKRLFDNAP